MADLRLSHPDPSSRLSAIHGNHHPLRRGFCSPAGLRESRAMPSPHTTISPECYSLFFVYPVPLSVVLKLAPWNHLMYLLCSKLSLRAVGCPLCPPGPLSLGTVTTCITSLNLCVLEHPPTHTHPWSVLLHLASVNQMLRQVLLLLVPCWRSQRTISLWHLGTLELISRRGPKQMELNDLFLSIRPKCKSRLLLLIL